MSKRVERSRRLSESHPKPPKQTRTERRLNRKKAEFRQKAVQIGLILGIIAAGLSGAWYVARNNSAQGTEFVAEEIAHVLPEIQLYYPEISRLPLTQSAEIVSSVTTRYYNVTQARVDLDAAQSIVSFVEDLGASGALDGAYAIGNQVLILDASVRADRNRVFFVAPYEGPNPAWLTQLGAGPDIFGGTNYNFPESTMSFIRVPRLQHDFAMDTANEISSNAAFFVETAQSALAVHIVGGSGERGQEVLLNSLGEMYGQKLGGATYDQYMGAIAMSAPMVFPDISGVYPLLTFPETLYNAMPGAKVVELQ